MKFKPFEGIDDIRLGMSREEYLPLPIFHRAELQEYVGQRDETLFADIYIKIQSTEEVGAEFIEVADPAELWWEGIQLIGADFLTIANQIREKGHDCVWPDDDLIFVESLGLVLWSQDMEEVSTAAGVARSYFSVYGY